MALKTEEPSASQATAGYQHGILNQFSVPEPTIDEAPGFRSPPVTSSTRGAEDKITQPPPVQDTAAATDGEDAENGGAQDNDIQEEDVKVQQDQDDEASALVEDEEVPWGPHGLN
ncbi:hypothetical protein J4E83_010908 [Alternaria metachromatica]|uniref:uncharacterized protein n=1 Tax=Alternaria metachromatica TaxID=283354 RepID=UPI0020C27159|nr:uncharacterized protein J4E83_010908 [Alternaria metachromatica]KAI4605037.1 hypothetical protein J4E83_010908 [Alternaria metachromatica]